MVRGVLFFCIFLYANFTYAQSGPCQSESCRSQINSNSLSAQNKTLNLPIICPQSEPFAYPTNNQTYNNLGWGGTCRKCPETAPWDYQGSCHN